MPATQITRPLGAAELLARRAVRFAPGGPVPPPPLRPAGGLQDAEAAARACAFLLGVAVRGSGPTLLSVALAADKLPAPAGAGGVATPPTPPVRRGVYDAGLHRGAGVLLHNGLLVAQLLTREEMRGLHKDAADSAYALDTFCVVSDDCTVPPVLATTATLGGVDALLLAARRAPSVLLREDAPAETARGLALSTDTLLPALRHAVDVMAAHIAGVASAHGDSRTQRQLTLRAHGALLQRHLARSLAWDRPGYAPPAFWRRAFYTAALEATGAKDPSTRPPFSDPRGIALAAGWEPRTRATSGFPFPAHPTAPGQAPSIDVAGLHAAIERASGPLADDDPLWTVLGQAYLYRPKLSPEFHAELAAAKAAGRAVMAPEVGAAPKASPFSTAQMAERFAECFASGVADAGTAADAFQPGNYIAGAKFVEKNKLDVPAEVRALDALHGGGAPPPAIAGVAAAARATALAIIAEMEADVAAGTDAETALEMARGRRTTARSLRLCHNGRHLGTYMDTVSYVCSTIADVLQGAEPGDLLWSHDFSSFFWVVHIDPAWRHLYWQEHTAPDGKRTYLRGNRMTMGMKDSSSLAQAISALTCELAAHYGAPWVKSYTDDLMARAKAAEVATAVAAIARAMDTVVPGGENVAKRSAPSPINTLIGYTVDLSGAVPRVFIALPRLYHYLVHLFVTQGCLSHASEGMRRSVTTVSISKLVGRLSYLSDFSGGGRPTLAPLYAQLWAGTPPWGKLRGSILTAVAYWTERATSGALPVASLVTTGDAVRINVAGGGAADAPPIASHHAPVVQQSDAGAPAGAAFVNGRVVYRLFTAAERGRDSAWRELVTVLCGVRHFLPVLRGRVVLIVSDHGGNVACINRGSAKSRAARRLIAELYRLAEENGFVFAAAWTPRECNEGPDRVAGCASRAEALATCMALGVSLEG